MTDIRSTAVDLDLHSLLRTASQEAGHEDYGDEAFVPYLGRYLEAVAEANLSPAGLAGQAVTIVRYLVNRLRLHADLKRHPEIREEAITEPVFIIGLPRTGTTKLQRMLSQDPSNQNLRLWRILNPAPLPGAEDGAPDPRVTFAEATVAALEECFPAFAAGHPMGAQEPDEDAILLFMTFQHSASALTLNAPSYHAWIEALPAPAVEAAYEYERLLLQYLQWQDGGGRGRPWILKTPTHIGKVGAILRVFPDATFIHCHRDLPVAVASTCLLMEQFWSSLGHAHLDPDKVGGVVLRAWARQFEHYVRGREQRNDPGRFVDVAFDRTVENPISVVEHVYTTRGRSLTSEARAQMRCWEGNSDRARRDLKPRPYSLERYGLTPQAVSDAFAPYNALVERLTAWA